jgi:acyl carrier protein
MKMNCLCCGNENPKKGMKTCSRKCADELKKKNSRETRNCLFCNNEFEVRKKETKQLCSEQCRKEWASLPENIEIRIKNSKEAIKEKFGVDNVFQLESIKEKSKKTKSEKYGDENYNNLEKHKLTTFERYGVFHATQNEEIKKKVKNTIKERFGVEHHLQLPEIIEKQKQTNLKRYGFYSASKNDKIKNKIKKIAQEKYGVENVSQNKEIKQKKKDTSLKNFGVSHHLKDKEMFQKHQKSQYRVHKYKETELYYNGSYEKHFLELMEEKGLLNEIYNGDSFIYILNDCEHTYHVDYKFRNNQIEIKSGWTYNKNGKDIELQNLNETKWNSVREKGENLIVLIDKSEIKGFVKAL